MQFLVIIITVEPPKIGHFGDNTNSTILSSHREVLNLSKLIIGIGIHGTCMYNVHVYSSSCVLCREVYFTVSLLRGSTIGSLTV